MICTKWQRVTLFICNINWIGLSQFARRRTTASKGEDIRSAQLFILMDSQSLWQKQTSKTLTKCSEAIKWPQPSFRPSNSNKHKNYQSANFFSQFLPKICPENAAKIFLLPSICAHPI